MFDKDFAFRDHSFADSSTSGRGSRDAGFADSSTNWVCSLRPPVLAGLGEKLHEVEPFQYKLRAVIDGELRVIKVGTHRISVPELFVRTSPFVDRFETFAFVAGVLKVDVRQPSVSDRGNFDHGRRFSIGIDDDLSLPDLR